MTPTGKRPQRRGRPTRRPPQRSQTRRRPTRAVFWRRRIIALIILVLVVALVVLGVRWLVSFAHAAVDASSSAKTHDVTKTFKNPVPCDAKTLRVSVENARTRIGRATPVPVKVHLSALTPEAPCYIDVGGKAAGLVVTGNGKTYYDSRRCVKGDQAKPLKVLLGLDVKYDLDYTWDALSHDADCAKGPDALAGDYKLSFYSGNRQLGQAQTVTVVGPQDEDVDQNAPATPDQDGKPTKSAKPGAAGGAAKGGKAGGPAKHGAKDNQGGKAAGNAKGGAADQDQPASKQQGAKGGANQPKDHQPAKPAPRNDDADGKAKAPANPERNDH